VAVANGIPGPARTTVPSDDPANHEAPRLTGTAVVTNGLGLGVRTTVATIVAPNDPEPAGMTSRPISETL